MIEQQTSRTKFNLENCLRMAFFPTGVGEFARGVNYELGFGNIQSKISIGLGTALDIVKYIGFFYSALYLSK